jgi:hypothetical protein
MSVVNSMVNQVEDLVANGWYAHFQFIAAAVDLVCTVALVCAINWMGLLPLAFLIPAIGIVAQCRRRKLVTLLERRVTAELGWLDAMNEAMQNWMLIGAYQMRSSVSTEFKHIYDKVCSSGSRSSTTPTIRGVVVAVVVVPRLR